jgi:hypothetical protein
MCHTLQITGQTLRKIGNNSELTYFSTFFGVWKALEKRPFSSAYVTQKMGETMSTQFEVFWVVTPCSVMVWYKRFRISFCLFLQGEDGGCMHLWNFGILLQHYTVSQPRRTRRESSRLWEPLISMPIYLLAKIKTRFHNIYFIQTQENTSLHKPLHTFAVYTISPMKYDLPIEESRH